MKQIQFGISPMTTRLDETTVRHVARLARLALNEQEIATFSEQLSTIVSYMTLLNEVDTTAVEPTAHPLPIRNVFREDGVQSGLPTTSVLANAPDRQDDFFRVPKVLEQEGA